MPIRYKRADAVDLQRGICGGRKSSLRNAVRATTRTARQAHLKLAQTQVQLADMVAAEREFKDRPGPRCADRWAIIPQLGQVYMSQGHYQDVLTEVPPEGPTPAISPRRTSCCAAWPRSA